MFLKFFNDVTRDSLHRPAPACVRRPDHAPHRVVEQQRLAVRHADDEEQIGVVGYAGVCLNLVPARLCFDDTGAVNLL